MSGLLDDKYLLNLLNAEFFHFIRVKTFITLNIKLIIKQVDIVDCIGFNH